MKKFQSHVQSFQNCRKRKAKPYHFAGSGYEIFLVVRLCTYEVQLRLRDIPHLWGTAKRTRYIQTNFWLEKIFVEIRNKFTKKLVFRIYREKCYKEILVGKRFRAALSLLHILVILSSLYSPERSVRVRAFPDRPVSAVLSRTSFPDLLVTAVRSWLSCPNFPVMSWLSSPGYPAQLTCPSSLVLTVLPSCHSQYSCLQLFYSRSPVLVAILWISCPICSIPDALC